MVSKRVSTVFNLLWNHKTSWNKLGMFTEWSSEKFMLFCWSEVQKVTRGPMVSTVLNLLWNHRTSWNKLGMFTEWPLKKFLLLTRGTKSYKRPNGVKKGVVCFESSSLSCTSDQQKETFYRTFQWISLPSLILIGPVVSEKKIQNRQHPFWHHWASCNFLYLWSTTKTF
jgi:hypothetical protein